MIYREITMTRGLAGDPEFPVSALTFNREDDCLTVFGHWHRYAWGGQVQVVRSDVLGLMVVNNGEGTAIGGLTVTEALTALKPWRRRHRAWIAGQIEQERDLLDYGPYQGD